LLLIKEGKELRGGNIYKLRVSLVSSTGDAYADRYSLHAVHSSLRFSCGSLSVNHWLTRLVMTSINSPRF